MRLWLLLTFFSILIHAEIVKVDIECEEPSEKLVDHREMPLFMVKCVKSSVGPPLYHLAECAEPKLSKRLKNGETRIQKEAGYSTVIGCLGRTNSTEDYRWYFGPIECIINDQKISAFPPNNVYFDAKAGKKFVCDTDKMTLQPYHAAETTSEPMELITMLPVTPAMTTKKATPTTTTKIVEPVTTTTKKTESKTTTTKKPESATTTTKIADTPTTTKTVTSTTTTKAPVVPDDVEKKTTEPVTPPKTTSSCGTIANFPTADKCWMKWNDTNSGSLCDARFGHLKDDNAVWESFTGASCSCGAAEKGNGFFCYRPCGRDDIRKLRCPESFVCQINVTNQAYCGCPPGQKIFNHIHCIPEEDSCKTCKHDCHAASTCFSGSGLEQKPFSCGNCNPELGYNGGNGYCKDIDECKSENNCDEKAVCHNRIPLLDNNMKYECICNAGYEGQGTKCSPCKDINECLVPGVCGPAAQCINTDGSYSCKCNPGYVTGPSGNCVDVDECLTMQYPCRPNSKCNNTIGSYNCPCEEGYVGNGRPENNEGCELDRAICTRCDSKSTECVINEKGTAYECRCKTNYLTVDAISCKPRTYCDKRDQVNCAPVGKADCFDRPDGSGYDCKCSANFTGDGKSCREINICLREKPCTNVPGTFCKADENNIYDKYGCPCLDNHVKQIADQMNTTGQCYSIFDFGANNCSVCTEREECYTLKNTELKSCKCKDGYKHMADGRCHNVNECQTNENDCDEYRATCIDKDPVVDHSKYECKCKRGYDGTGQKDSCANVDECVVGDSITTEPVCQGEGELCEDTIGSYVCNCKEGFTRRENHCEDVNECTMNIHRCPAFTKCINTVPGYKCECLPGFEGKYFENKTLRSCENIDECKVPTLNNCDPEREQCLDVSGSYLCRCKQGFQKINQHCDDVDECQNEHDNKCSLASTTCNNTFGGYFCACKQGFEVDKSGAAGSNLTCKDIDECNTASHQCHANSYCKNTKGSYFCVCDEGFEISPNSPKGTITPYCIREKKCEKDKTLCIPGVCVDIDNEPYYRCDCIVGTINYNNTACIDSKYCNAYEKDFECPAHAECKGKGICECEQGYRWQDLSIPFTIEDIRSKRSCKPIDFCATPGICGEMKCKTTKPGDGECYCSEGYKKEGTKCIDINECENNKVCSTNTTCHNTEGSYECFCPTGYIHIDGPKTSPICENVNECLHKMDNCTSYKNSHCEDSPGSFVCACNRGYKRDQLGNYGDYRDCIDEDECERKDELCDKIADCTNTIGSYFCSCPTGYRGDGDKGLPCIDVDECDLLTHNCSAPSQRCVNDPGAFHCECSKGYESVGGKCQNVNECLKKLDNCDGLEQCVDTEGSFYCDCAPGYYRPKKDGKCVDQNECLLPASCPSNTGDYCNNTIGSYECTCKPGFEKPKSCRHKPAECPCEDVNECIVGKKDGSSFCGKNTNCTNLIGSATCVCKTNYAGDAYSTEGCKLVNVCENTPKPCSEYKNTICKAKGEAEFECPCASSDFVRVGLKSLVCRPIICNGPEDLKDPFCKNGVCREALNKDTKQYEALCICKDNEIAVNTTKPGKQECITKDVCKCGEKPIPCIGSPVCSDPSKMTCTPHHEKTDCVCLNYFKYNEKTKKCDEQNHCSPNPCPANATCSAIKDGQGFNMTFRCTCPEGQKIEMVNGVAQCVRDNDNCEKCKSIPHSECTDPTDPYAICQCKLDYVRGIDSSCVLDDACKRWARHNPKEKRCGENARPQSDEQNTKCTCACNVGFKHINETDCEDKNECLEFVNPCSANVSHPECENTIGSYRCGCGVINKNFELKDGICQLINRCINNTCDALSTTCQPLTGVCSCNIGFEQFNQTTCININECERKMFDCPQDSTCVDKTPGYDCECDHGFNPVNLTSVDPKPHHPKGFKCVDKDECKEPNVCPPEAKCINEIGSFRCDCQPPQFNVGKYNCAFNSTKDCNCNENAHCILVASTAAKTTHNCTCNAGYKEDGANCIDIDECPAACASNAKCTNLPGSYRCDCPPPLQGSGLAGQNCIRIPHCNPNPCPVGSQCSLLDKQVEGKWYNCTCPKGLIYNPVANTCDNVNECALCTDHKNCPCPKLATECIDTQGSFTCNCPTGYIYDSKDNLCKDINECETGESNLKCLTKMGTCVNEIGSWNCTCFDGYENKKGDKQVCEEIIICGTDRDPCNKNTTDCVSTGPGKFECDCKSGYVRDIMDANNCEDINECVIGAASCDLLTEVCINNLGSYHCDCLANYTRPNNDTSQKCVPDKPCPNKCPEGAACYLDRNDEPVCKCPYNYELTPDNKTCTIRSCELQGAYCPGNAKCQFVQIRNDTLRRNEVTAPNQAGNYRCVCEDPFMLDSNSGTCTVKHNICQSVQCRENEECKTIPTKPYFACKCKPGEVCKNTTQECTPEMCGKNAECILIRKTPACKCKPGFAGLGTTISDCKPTKQCDEKTCSVFASCQNDVCVCDSHYHGNGTTCYDKNECTEKKADGSVMHNCDAQADCVNTQGGFICKCKTGYAGTGHKCDDVDECSLNLDNCHAETTDCQNTAGSSVCKCKDGFDAISGNNNKCQDVDECVAKIDKCDNTTSNCFNTIPGYSCECKSGYRNSPINNKICLNVDECQEKLHDCHIHANCKDLIPAQNNGSKFMCICKEGYTGTGTACTAIDQCAINNGGCDSKTTICKMMWEVPEARCDCRSGFEKENQRDKTCKNKNECINGEAVFDKENTECSDTDGSYELKCKTGYENKHPQASATNAKCEDLDECAMDAAYVEALKVIQKNQETREYTNEQIIDKLPVPKNSSSGYAICYNYAKAKGGFGTSAPVFLPMCKNEKPEYTFGRTRPVAGMPTYSIRGFSCDCGVDTRKNIEGNNYKCEDAACNCVEILGEHAICNGTKCICRSPWILKYEQSLGKSVCDEKECSLPITYPQKISAGGKENLILCDNGTYRAVDGYRIVRNNETNEIIDIIDINECEEGSSACCLNEKTCNHELCVKCVNTQGSFRCALAKNESIDCSKGCVDVNTCKCNSIVCPVQDAWFYNCERKCNASSHPSLDKPEFNRKLCSRFVDDSGSQYKTLNSLRELYIEICKFNDDYNNRYACMFGGNDNDLTKSPMFNYWGECQDGANAAKVVCQNGQPGKRADHSNDDGLLLSRAVCAPEVEEWPLERTIVNGAQVKKEAIIVGAGRGVDRYPSNGIPWCRWDVSKQWFKDGNFFALPSGQMMDFF